jgi:hypothetical protein
MVITLGMILGLVLSSVPSVMAQAPDVASEVNAGGSAEPVSSYGRLQRLIEAHGGLLGLQHHRLRAVVAALAPASPTPEVPTTRQALQCDFGRSQQDSGRGYWEDLAHGVASPREALKSAIREGWVIPKRGYRVLTQDDGAVLYGFSNRGEVKVAIRVVRSGDSIGDWMPERLSSCTLAEFGGRADMGPGVWLWADRRGRTIQERRGTAQCGGASARFIFWRKRGAPESPRHEQWYVRDPEATFRDRWQAPYLRRTSLPADAKRTGYKRDGAGIWMAADGRSIFIKHGDDVQRWPRLTGVGCA